MTKPLTPDGGSYYATDQPLKTYAEHILRDEILKIEFNSILDVGCGDGHFLKNFPDKKIAGIDISPGMIALADTKIQPHLRICDITNASHEFIAANKEAFDVVSSNYVFMEMKEEQIIRAFLNIRQTLGKNGRFLFVITDPRNRDKEFPGIKAVFGKPYSYEKEGLEYQVLLQRNGLFIDCDIRDYHYPLEAYDRMVIRSGFSGFTRQDIKSPTLPYSFAVMYKIENL